MKKHYYEVEARASSMMGTITVAVVANSITQAEQRAVKILTENLKAEGLPGKIRVKSIHFRGNIYVF